MAEYSNSAIVFGDLKQALLYFEYVVPINAAGSFMKLRPEEVLNNAKSDAGMNEYHDAFDAFPNQEALLALCPPQLRKQPKFQIAVNTFDSFLFSFMVKTSEGEEAYRKYLGHLGVKDYVPAPTLEGLRRLFAFIVNDFGMKNMLVDCSAFVGGQNAQEPTSASLSLQQIELVDTDSVSFSDILELRKDKEAMGRMREFRLFAYANYEGKNRAFIEDDISKRLDEYHRAVKSLGLKTRNKNLTFLLESKSMMFAGLAALYSLISASPEALVTASGLGAMGWKLAHLVIELGNQKADFLHLSSEHPVSYIADLEKKFES